MKGMELLQPGDNIIIIERQMDREQRNIGRWLLLFDITRV